MPTSTANAKPASEARPAADTPQPNAQATAPSKPTLVNTLLGPIKKLLGGS